MSTPAIEISVPSSAIAEAFNDGERAVSPGSVALLSAAYLAKWIVLDGGIYTLKLWGADIVTAYVGMEGTSIRRIASATDALIEADFFTHPGKQRLDVALNTVTSDVPYFVLSIWQGGRLVYASSGDGWVYSSTAIPDADVPDEIDVRRTLPVWSVLPNWGVPVMERLSWLTQILPSETDFEQRRSLRRYPRRSIEASFLRSGPAGQRIDSFLAGVGRRSFLVPLWFEQLRIADGINIPEPVILPDPYWEDTFTAADGTKPDARDIDVFPAVAGYNRWVYLLGSSYGAINSNRLGQAANVENHWYDYQIALSPSGDLSTLPQSLIGTALVVDVFFENVRAPITNEARQKIDIGWNVGYGLTTTLRIWEDGSSTLNSGTGTITSPALSGTGTVRYVVHFSTGTSINPVRYFVNGVNQGGEHHSAKSWTNSAVTTVLGSHERIRVDRMAAYMDIDSDTGVLIAGEPTALLPRPPYPTPPATLTAIVRDTFTATDGTNAFTRTPDVAPTGLFEGGGWINATGTSQGVIIGNRLRLTSGGQTIVNNIEHRNRTFGEIVPCFPITLFLHGACGVPSLNTIGNDPYVNVGWGYWNGYYFELTLYRGNTYYASAAGYEWMSNNYWNGGTPNAGAGAHKLALFYDGNNAYLIVDGVVVETSPSLSHLPIDPRSQVGFAVEMKTKSGSDGTETYAEEVALYYGGTLSQAIALTA